MRVALLFLLLSLFLFAKMDQAHSTISENTENAVTEVSDNGWFTKPFYSYLPNLIVRRVTEALHSTFKAALYSYMDDVTSGFTEKVRSTLEATLYHYMDNMTSEFTEKVRSTLESALYHYMDNMTSRFTEKVRSSLESVLYHYMDNMTSGFTEKVRSMMHEKFYELQDSMWELIAEGKCSILVCNVDNHYNVPLSL